MRGMEALLEQVESKGRVPGSIKPGEVRNPGGRKKGKPELPQVLRDMRAVYRQEESKDEGEGQRSLRRVLQDDPKAFMNQLASLERVYRPVRDGVVSPSEGSESSPVEADGGLELCREVAARWLEEQGNGGGS